MARPLSNLARVTIGNCSIWALGLLGKTQADYNFCSGTGAKTEKYPSTDTLIQWDWAEDSLKRQCSFLLSRTGCLKKKIQKMNSSRTVLMSQDYFCCVPLG